jgi:hypothetical protein
VSSGEPSDGAANHSKDVQSSSSDAPILSGQSLKVADAQHGSSQQDAEAVDGRLQAQHAGVPDEAAAALAEQADRAAPEGADTEAEGKAGAAEPERVAGVPRQQARDAGAGKQAQAMQRPSALPDTQTSSHDNMTAALANISDLAAIFPDTQAPNVVAPVPADMPVPLPAGMQNVCLVGDGF